MFLAPDTIDKIKVEMNQWFSVQEVETRNVISPANHAVRGEEKWNRPPDLWLKCNVGMSWSKRNGLGGFSWVLRDRNGVVILHSRRTFSGIRTLEDAKLKSLLWTIESMGFHRFNHVIFTSDAIELVNAIYRPAAWPSFCYHVSELLLELEKIDEWRLVFENRLVNRVAFLIAQSVTLENRFQSYVAQDPPAWLHELFDCERGASWTYFICDFLARVIYFRLTGM